jgi:hypothetical protein
MTGRAFDMDTGTDEILRCFGELLVDRFSKRVHTTEDSIRYNLFHCLTAVGGFHPSEVILEFPHSSIPRAKVDVFIPPANRRSGFVFEFKFDRGIPSGRSQPRPQKAGKVFADASRLAKFRTDGAVKRILIYVLDPEMSAYFRNPQNGLDDFFGLERGGNLRLDRNYIGRHCQTFARGAGIEFVESELNCLANKSLPRGFELRIYEVKPLIADRR